MSRRWIYISAQSPIETANVLMVNYFQNTSTAAYDYEFAGKNGVLTGSIQINDSVGGLAGFEGTRFQAQFLASGILSLHGNDNADDGSGISLSEIPWLFENGIRTDLTPPFAQAGTAESDALAERDWHLALAAEQPGTSGGASQYKLYYRGVNTVTFTPPGQPDPLDFAAVTPYQIIDKSLIAGTRSSVSIFGIDAASAGSQSLVYRNLLHHVAANGTVTNLSVFIQGAGAVPIDLRDNNIYKRVTYLHPDIYVIASDFINPGSATPGQLADIQVSRYQVDLVTPGVNFVEDLVGQAFVPSAIYTNFTRSCYVPA